MTEANYDINPPVDPVWLRARALIIDARVHPDRATGNPAEPAIILDHLIDIVRGQIEAGASDANIIAMLKGPQDVVPAEEATGEQS
jgi:hypothetical protein